MVTWPISRNPYVLIGLWCLCLILQSPVKRPGLRHWRSGSMALAVVPASQLPLCNDLRWSHRHEMIKIYQDIWSQCGWFTFQSKIHRTRKNFTKTGSTWATWASWASWPLHAVALQSSSPECVAPRYCAAGLPGTSWRKTAQGLPKQIIRQLDFFLLKWVDGQ